ncbi:MAG: hypothetical protein ABI035_05580 [Gemmatimonadaceae bacterium]
MNVVSIVTTALRELWGLFVEDGSFTIGIVLCIAIGIAILPRIAIPAEWRGAALFVILALVLLENVRRSARQ